MALAEIEHPARQELTHSAVQMGIAAKPAGGDANESVRGGENIARMDLRSMQRYCCADFEPVKPLFQIGGKVVGHVKGTPLSLIFQRMNGCNTNVILAYLFR
ncbi:hypothetical protein RMSM_07635 [Rhodopirellula maiorica SM1]|uniref:Uncharacterized protein n=1 Tax=Rhodopirellula maiorica SM1 TaxID=1265738 RepID=M5R8R6_9BACT|nr:hypothetical protein RMSM_07635 [Rhodopirellula maiorica SM1]